jgi:hypothetical protein
MAAAIVLVAHTVLYVLNFLLNTGIMLAQNSGEGMFPFLYLVSLFGVQLISFVAGMFLSLWLLAPITAGLRLIQVVGRSLLAALAGGLAWILIQLVLSLTESFDRSAALAFGWVSGLESTVSSNASWLFSNLIYTSLGTVVTFIPLTVLAGVVVWAWLRERQVAQATTEPNADV